MFAAPMPRVSPDGYLFYGPLPGEKVYGYDNGSGYRIIKWRGKTKCIHRLVAAEYVHNPRPDIFTQVDHINRVRDDNRAQNLRWVSAELNALNKDKSQVREIGSFYNPRSKRWVENRGPCFVGYYGNTKVTKAYKTRAEADEACAKWRDKMFLRTYEMLTSGPVCAFYNDADTGGRRSSRS